VAKQYLPWQVAAVLSLTTVCRIFVPQNQLLVWIMTLRFLFAFFVTFAMWTHAQAEKLQPTERGWLLDYLAVLQPNGANSRRTSQPPA
jgi:hypothetical protein